MLHQNWFGEKNMVKVEEYIEKEIYYDKNVKCFYIVTEPSEGIIAISEISPESDDYQNWVEFYNERKEMYNI